MTDQHIKEMAKQIADALAEEVDRSNPDEVAGKIDELRQLTANAASIKANAKKQLLKKEREVLEQYKGSKIQASILMRTISAECFEEEGWYVYCDRLNAGISHALDGMRSILSWMKTELENQVK